MTDCRTLLHDTWANDPSNGAYLDALQQCIGTSNHELAAEIAEHLAHYYLSMDEQTKARELLTTTISQTQDFALMHSLALIDMQAGNLNNAVKNLQRAQQHTPESNTPEIIYEKASINEHLGDCFHHQGTLLQAINHWQFADQHYHDADAPLERANILIKLANLLRNQGDIESAKSYYETALDLFKTSGDGLGEADCYVNLAKIAHQANELATAITLEQHAFAALENTQQYAEQVILMMQLNANHNMVRYAAALKIALEHTAPLEALIDLGARWHLHLDDGSDEQVWVAAAVVNKAELIGQRHERYPELFRIAVDNYFRAVKAAGVAENEITRYTQEHQLDQLDATTAKAQVLLNI